MDAKRMITTRIWADPWFEGLDTESKLVWIYLLTNQQTNLIGIYEISMKRISNETGVDLNRLQTVMERFTNSYKTIWNGSYMVICNFLKHQNIANPNMEKSAKKIFDQLPSEVRKVLKNHGIVDFKALLNGFPNRLQTVTKPFGEIERESEREIEIEREIENKWETEKIVDAEASDFENLEEDFSQEETHDSPRTLQAEDLKKEKVPAKRKSNQLELLEQCQLPFDSENFMKYWLLFLDYKQKMKKPYTSVIGMQAALKKCSNFSEEVVIESLTESISNNWQGFFPEKIKTNANGKSQQQTGISLTEQFNRLRAKAHSGSWG